MENGNTSDIQIWDIYFATLAGWTLHPGYQKPGTTAPDLIHCAELANKMMEIRQWPDGEQQPLQQQAQSDNGAPTTKTNANPPETEGFKNE